MRPWTSLLVAACLVADLVGGFPPPAPRRPRLPATKLHAVMPSMYADDISKLMRLPSDEAIFILTMMRDDGIRRRTVRSYLDNGVKMEKMMLTPGSCWAKDRSAFVREAKEHLKSISASVQHKEWEKYITAGGQKLHYKPTQLWACIDMTVQFSRIICDFDDECRLEASEAFQ